MIIFIELMLSFITKTFLIREAKLAYKAEVLELQKQLERQQSLFDMLAGQASALIQGRRARVSATSAVNAQLITLDEKLSARNLEVDLIFPNLSCHVLMMEIA